jgi:hypothetical protein
VFGFFLGVALFLCVIHLVEETGCPRCEGTGILSGKVRRVSWAGSNFGLVCHICDGEGKTRRIWFYLGENG